MALPLVWVSYGKWYIWKSVILCMVNRYRSHEIYLRNVCRYFARIFYFPRNFSSEKGNEIHSKTIDHSSPRIAVLWSSLEISSIHIVQCSVSFWAGGRGWEWFHIQLKISLTENLMRHKNQIYCIIRLMTCFHSLDWTFNCSLRDSFGTTRRDCEFRFFDNISIKRTQ